MKILNNNLNLFNQSLFRRNFVFYNTPDENGDPQDPNPGVCPKCGKSPCECGQDNLELNTSVYETAKRILKVFDTSRSVDVRLELINAAEEGLLGKKYYKELFDACIKEDRLDIALELAEKGELGKKYYKKLL